MIAIDENGEIQAKFADGQTADCAEPLEHQKPGALIHCALNTPNNKKTVFIRRGTYVLQLPDDSRCGGVSPQGDVSKTANCAFFIPRDQVTIILEAGAELVVPNGYRGAVFKLNAERAGA